MTLNSPSRDIADLLAAEVTAAAPFYAVEWGKDVSGEIEKQGLIQDSPNETPVIDTTSYEQLIFTVIMRGKSSETSDDVYSRAQVVHNFLIQSVPQTVDGTLYKYFTPMAPLQSVGRDEHGRHMTFAKYFTYRDVDS